MTSKPIKRLLVLGTAIIALAAAGSASAAWSPAEAVTDAVSSQASDIRGWVTVECVSGSELASLSGSRDTVGLWNPLTSTISLHNRWVCKQLAKYVNGTANAWQAGLALSTIYHEVWHARGVVSERKAECKGVRTALKELRAWGETNGTIAAVRDFLIYDVDEYRSPEYDIAGYC